MKNNCEYFRMFEHLEYFSKLSVEYIHTTGSVIYLGFGASSCAGLVHSSSFCKVDESQNQLLTVLGES